MMSIRHVSDHRSEPLEQQPKNSLALALGPAQPLGVVMEDGAGGAALCERCSVDLSAVTDRRYNCQRNVQFQTQSSINCPIYRSNWRTSRAENKAGLNASVPAFRFWNFFLRLETDNSVGDAFDIIWPGNDGR